MKVKVAKTAGFCFGVKRAVDKVYQLIEEGVSPIYTLGPIIHNEEVVSDLESRGVQVIQAEELDQIRGGTVVIRSHGVGRDIYQKLKENNLEYVDVTCPFVLKIHRIVEKESLAGRQIFIFGDPKHPEVQGICGWCHGPYRVLKNREDVENMIPDPDMEACIVSQTTFNYNKFKELVEIICKKRVMISYIVLNTICSATEERQTEAKDIAGRGRRYACDRRQTQLQYSKAI